MQRVRPQCYLSRTMLFVSTTALPCRCTTPIPMATRWNSRSTAMVRLKRPTPSWEVRTSLPIQSASSTTQTTCWRGCAQGPLYPSFCCARLMNLFHQFGVRLRIRHRRLEHWSSLGWSKRSQPTLRSLEVRGVLSRVLEKSLAPVSSCGGVCTDVVIRAYRGPSREQSSCSVSE